MATTHDVRHRRVEPALEEGLRAADLVVGAEALRARLGRRADQTPQWVRPGRLALMKGAAGWLALSFVVAYLVNPALVAAIGVDLNLVGFSASLPAFAATSAAVVLLVGLVRPSVRLPTVRGKLDTSPEVAATAGSLTIWGLGEQLLPVFEPFTRMPWDQLAALLTLNLVESSLIGVMLASFTRSPARAFGMGAATQVVLTFLTAFLTLIGLG